MKLFFMSLLILLTSCSAPQDFKIGECLMGPDGFVIRVNQTEGSKYLAQDLVDGSWTGEYKKSFSELSRKKGHMVVPCPPVKMKP